MQTVFQEVEAAKQAQLEQLKKRIEIETGYEPLRIKLVHMANTSLIGVRVYAVDLGIGGIGTFTPAPGMDYEDSFALNPGAFAIEYTNYDPAK